MEIINVKKTVSHILLLGIVMLSHATLQTAWAAVQDRPPGLPPQCTSIEAPAGSELLFHVYALGVQIYRWDGTRWNFVGPEARLFVDPNYRRLVGSHYGGPTWESNSGSTVAAARIDGCTPDPTAIPWLLLRTVSGDVGGIFGGTTHIQRTHTAGGLTPPAPGTIAGEEKRVPYTAEYYFYQSVN